MSARSNRFTVFQCGLHWVMAALIVAMLFIGVAMVPMVDRAYVPLTMTHKTLGILIFVLALIRVAVRLRYGTPPLPADLPAPMKLAAKASHYALYALMFAMPLLGYAMMSTAAYPIVLFGKVRIPSLLPQSDALHTLFWNAHAILAFAFFAVVLLHFSAALFHGLIRRDGVLSSITNIGVGEKAPGGRTSVTNP